MKTSLFPICALLLFYGCSHDDAPVIATGNFESTAMIKNDPVVLYTKDKTITDTTFLRAFLERHETSQVFDLTAGMVTSPIHVTFDNRVADSVYLGFISDAGSRELIFNQVYYDNTTAIYIGRDSLPASPSEDGELSCSNVGQRIRRHPLLTDCVPTPPPFNYWVCKARYQVPVMLNGNDVSIPIISYYFTDATTFPFCWLWERYIFSQFNEDALKTIHTTDTLIVQRRTLVLQKK